MTDTAIDKISFGCKKDFQPLIQTMEQMQSMMTLARQTTEAVFDLMDCERMAAIYSELVYEAGCTHSIQGFTWAFSCLLAVSFLAMVMLTLRSAFQNTCPVDDEESVEDKMQGSEDGKLTTGLGSSMNDSRDQRSQENSESEEKEVLGVAEEDEESQASSMTETQTGELLEMHEMTEPPTSGPREHTRRDKTTDLHPAVDLDISC